MKIRFQRDDGSCGYVEGGKSSLSQFLPRFVTEELQKLAETGQPLVTHNVKSEHVETPLIAPTMNFGELDEGSNNKPEHQATINAASGEAPLLPPDWKY